MEHPHRKHAEAMSAIKWRNSILLVVGRSFDKIRMSLAHPPHTAVCADGSPAWFHMATNASSSDYVFYLEGGAVSCAHNQALCTEALSNNPALVSEREVIHVGGLLSGDQPQVYSTFNRVLIPYCSMDMFLLDTKSADGELQFRGRQLLE